MHHSPCKQFLGQIDRSIRVKSLPRIIWPEDGMVQCRQKGSVLHGDEDYLVHWGQQIVTTLVISECSQSQTSRKSKKNLICPWHAYCWISTNKSKISQIHLETYLIPSHFCLICDLNQLKLHLMHLIKCIKSISQQRQISFFGVFLMKTCGNYDNKDWDPLILVWKTENKTEQKWATMRAVRIDLLRQWSGSLMSPMALCSCIFAFSHH
jgi:hypothetical protein